MKAIPEQLAAQVGIGNIRLGTRVDSIDGTTVTLEGGEVVEASSVVVATDATTADRLLGTDSGTEFNKTECMYFSSDKKLELDGEPFLIINSNKDEMIDHIFLASDSVPSYSESGKTLISVNTVGDKTIEEDAVKTELASWFGDDHEWSHLRTFNIPEALPRFESASNGLELKVSENVFRCGDYTAYPSLNGAMKSGRRVAQMVLA